MARTPQDVTDAELSVLEVLWKRGPMAVREIAQELYPGNSASDTATAQKLCERLLQKGFVARDRSTRPATISAAVDRDELIGRHLQGVADKLCSGSVAPLLSHLVEAAGLSPKELRKLREQVERLDQDSPPRRER